MLDWDYNVSGWLREHPSNRRRLVSSDVQLARLKFKARPDLRYETLTDNAQEIYLTNVLRWNLPRDAAMNEHIKDMFVPEFVEGLCPAAYAELFGSPRVCTELPPPRLITLLRAPELFALALFFWQVPTQGYEVCATPTFSRG